MQFESATKAYMNVTKKYIHRKSVIMTYSVKNGLK